MTAIDDACWALELGYRGETIAAWLDNPLPPHVGRSWPEAAVAQPDELCAYLAVHPEQLRRFVDRALTDAELARQHHPIGPPPRWSETRDATPHVEASL